MNGIKVELSKSFEMKDFGPARCCLGIEFQQEKDFRVIITQANYVMSILERFNMKDCKPAKTPIDTNVRLCKPIEPDESVMKLYPYQSLIGALMFLAVSTRPDIAYSVNFLSQFNVNYASEHWTVAKRILRYLKGTVNYGLMYQKSGELLFGVVDADWGANTVDRRSYSGFAFMFAGAAICWDARKQRTVALSSVEAEYVAISEATKEAIYLRNMFNETSKPCNKVVIYNDSQGAQRLASSTVAHHGRTKHVDLRHHFIREKCNSGVIDLKYLSTEEMSADVLTKGLNGTKHNSCLNGLGMIDFKNKN